VVPEDYEVPEDEDDIMVMDDDWMQRPFEQQSIPTYLKTCRYR